MGLAELRKQIDEIDIELQKLFEKRMAICDEVAREKKRTNAPVLQGNREEQILEAVRSRSAEGFSDSSEEFLKAIMAISRGRQKKLLTQSFTIPSGDIVNVIIPCGGSSSRMGFNKLMYSLKGREVVLRTIDCFDKTDNVSRIILSASDSIKSELEAMISKENYSKEIIIVDGGSSRQQSVSNAAKHISADCDYICVHDGARPFIGNEIIKRAIEDAKQTGASVVCVEAKDTIKVSDGSIVSQTPPRNTLFLAQTPQIIAKELYLMALESAEAMNKEYTDDVSLCEAIGVMPKITLGSYSNIKLTTPEDISVAEAILDKSEVNG